MRRFFRILTIVVINVAIVTGFFGVLEYALRRVQHKRLGPKSEYPASYRDRWTAWRNAPDYERFDIKHNRQGFRRSADVSLDKPAGAVRIFFLGGSAAYGCEGLFKELDPDWKRIYNHQLIDAYLEKKLQVAYPQRRWEVINAATNEFRMHQHLALLYSDLLRYKPDAVLFMDGHNDISGIISSTTDPYHPYAETPHREEFQNLVYPRSLQSLLVINSAWLRNNSVLFRIMQDRATAFGGGEFGQPNQAGDAQRTLRHGHYYVEAVERLQHALVNEHVLALFALQPETILSGKPLTPAESRFAAHFRELSGKYTVEMYQALEPMIAKEVSASAAVKGYDFVDLRNVFDQEKEKTFTDYCHLTPLGNERIAEKLFESMKVHLIPALLHESR
jgi:lysophospholipase L1-like esterase